MVNCLMSVALLLALPQPGRGAEKLPETSEVVRRMLERAQAVAQDTKGPQYGYEKRTVLEHLDSKGQVTKSEEKIHQVKLIAGVPFNRLVRIQGRELNEEELKREERKEERFRERFTSINTTNMAARREAWVTSQLLARYQFTLKERTLVNNRPTLVLTFRPNPTGPAGKSIRDLLLNHLEGTVWLDEQEAEATRLSVHLTETVTMGWLGVLGSLSQCDLSLERKRMPEGVWVNATQILRVQYRKLASTIRFRNTEESRDFTKLLASARN